MYGAQFLIIGSDVLRLPTSDAATRAGTVLGWSGTGSALVLHTLTGRDPIIGIADIALVPPTEVNGDRYLLLGSNPNAAWDGVAAGRIATFDGSAWVDNDGAPADGWQVYVAELGEAWQYYETAPVGWYRAAKVSGVYQNADDPAADNSTWREGQFYQWINGSGNVAMFEWIDVAGTLTPAERIYTDPGTVDHGSLQGLADDDHAQYALADGSRGAFAATSHTHAIGDVTSLQTTLDAKAASSHTHTVVDVTDFAESVDDRVALLLVEGTGITLTYDDGAGTITIDAAGGGGSAVGGVDTIQTSDGAGGFKDSLLTFVDSGANGKNKLTNRSSYLSFFDQGSTESMALAPGGVELVGVIERGGVHQLRMRDDVAISWGSNVTSWNLFDLCLYRDAADSLAIRRDTNPQAFALASTYTDDSNLEQLLAYAQTGGAFVIDTEALGTGIDRPLEIGFHSSASDPGTGDIAAGRFGVWKNTTGGTVKIWANDGGVMKSVELT